MTLQISCKIRDELHGDTSIGDTYGAILLYRYRCRINIDQMHRVSESNNCFSAYHRFISKAQFYESIGDIRKSRKILQVFFSQTRSLLILFTIKCICNVNKSKLKHIFKFNQINSFIVGPLLEICPSL